MSHWGIVLLLALVFTLTGYSTQAENDMTIQKGSKVSFDYTLSVDGKIVESSEGKEPLQYTHGEGQIIPGLSRQLEGLHEGDEKKILLPPEEAYGKVNPNAFKEVLKSQLPPNLDPQVGMMLRLKTQEGGSVPVRIAEVKKDAIALDLNHLLAGKTLDFQVKIISIE